MRFVALIAGIDASHVSVGVSGELQLMSRLALLRNGSSAHEAEIVLAFIARPPSVGGLVRLVAHVAGIDSAHISGGVGAPD